MPLLHEDRLFPSDAATRGIARGLYESVRDLPIISPHGHTEAAWFSENLSFPDPTRLLILPDHYIYRMLYSQGISMKDLGIRQENFTDSRRVWRTFAENYYLFRGTPTRIWLDYAFQELFGLQERLGPANANHYFDVISEKLSSGEFLPRALYDRFNIELLATTDSALDSLFHHQAIRDSGWKGRILPTFRPDAVVDPAFAGFGQNIVRLGELTGDDTTGWDGYLHALALTRQRFKHLGCKATDHGHPTANT
ncbi:MAG TPA: glucuronate isomerase, partial [Acidisarcina sp.]